MVVEDIEMMDLWCGKEIVVRKTRKWVDKNSGTGGDDDVYNRAYTGQDRCT